MRITNPDRIGNRSGGRGHVQVVTAIQWHLKRSASARRGPKPEPDAKPDPEADLIARAVRDPEAFGRLYRRHYPAIAGYLLRRCGDRHAAEDLAAETFLTAYQQLARFEKRGLGLRPWLYRIATNKANRRLRDEKRRQRRERGSARPNSPGAARDEPHAAHNALRSIPPRFQGVLVLHHAQGLSVAQVAEALGVPEGTVKSRLKRGRDAMRRALEQHETTEGGDA